MLILKEIDTTNLTDELFRLNNVYIKSGDGALKRIASNSELKVSELKNIKFYVIDKESEQIR